MAEVKALTALHYDRDAAGPLQKLIAPPYDVIDDAYRRRLASRSPHNVVEIDLPSGDDPYRNAGDLLARWRADGILVRDSEPAIWAISQTFDGPDGSQRTRRGLFCRVRLTDYGPGLVRPHERTHPAAKEDRLRLMRATQADLSPIFSLYSDEGEVWSALEPATASDPWAQVSDDERTTHTLWRVADPEMISKVEHLLADKELLIADGHHRYETARTYAEELGGEGDHRYVLMCLVSMSDPGLAVFPTHRVLGSVSEEARSKLADLIEREFRCADVEIERLAPEPGNALPTFGFFDRDSGRAMRLELSSPAAADSALEGHSENYRRLDSAVLETLVLEDALGLSEDDISHQRGLAYARDLDQAMSLLRDDGYDLAFLLRPTPIEQVRSIAESGETMPPKSTYFFPKLPSGLLFNPL